MGSSGSTVGMQRGDRQLVSQETVPLSDLQKLASRKHFYAILDACDAPAVPPKVKELGEDNAISLYRGGAEEDYWAIAPYLVHVDPSLLNWILATLWNEPWGIFAIAEAELPTLRTHFRKFLTVQMPDGEQVYFRFYDPRVLPQFLPTCNAADLAEFFGPIQAFGSKTEDAEMVAFWRR